VTRGAAALALVAALLLLAGCGGGKTTSRRAAVSPYTLSGPACLQALAAARVPVIPWPAAPSSGRSCRVETPVQASAGRLAAFAPPLKTSCNLLLAWTAFEAEVEEAARRYLRSNVAAIRHFGSFGCRRMSGNAGRLSLHAQARAFDVAGFQLADGRVVTVAAGWWGPSDQRRFLRAVARAACTHFSVVLTPDSDSDHRDHIHLDIGPWRSCG
jgi:hypothetical protein